MSGLPARGLIAAIDFYRRAISPVLGPRCRFAPTCSEYAADAVRLHGAGRGSWLAMRRIVRCAPWHPGGVDLVPPRRVAGSPAGTAQHVHSSDTAAAPVPTGRPTRAPRPPRGRTPQQEAGVA